MPSATKAGVKRSAAWIDRELQRMAKLIAAIESKNGETITATEVIEQELAEPLARRHARAVRRENAGLTK